MKVAKEITVSGIMSLNVSCFITVSVKVGLSKIMHKIGHGPVSSYFTSRFHEGSLSMSLPIGLSFLLKIIRISPPIIGINQVIVVCIIFCRCPNSFEVSISRVDIMLMVK